MSQPRVTREVRCDVTIYTTEYPCPCGKGVIEVNDGVRHATREFAEESLDQVVNECPRCGNDDAETAAELLAKQED